MSPKGSKKYAERLSEKSIWRLKIGAILLVGAISCSFVVNSGISPNVNSGEPLIAEEVISYSEMHEIAWPVNDSSEQLPAPPSAMGYKHLEYPGGFVIYIGEMTIDSFNDYITECQSMGFNLRCERHELYFYAYNINGYYLRLEYENNLMLLQLDDPQN